ncbi:hypothetical protein ACG7TL_007567 [Trametes sanguinea]
MYRNGFLDSAANISGPPVRVRRVSQPCRPEGAYDGALAHDVIRRDRLGLRILRTLDPLACDSPLLSPPNSLHPSPSLAPLSASTMSASTASKSTAAKGKKAATPAQIRAAAREELNALFASTPGGSIAGEEEYEDFARRVLAQLAPLALLAFRTPVPAPASTMPPPPPPTPQQLGLGGLDSTPVDPQRTPAGDVYVRALESVRDALSGQVAALAATRDELRLRARNAPLSGAEIFGHPANW